MSRTPAEELAHEQELISRRFVHATRPRGPMTIAEAMELCARMDGITLKSDGTDESQGAQSANRIGKDLANGG